MQQSGKRHNTIHSGTKSTPPDKNHPKELQYHRPYNILIQVLSINPVTGRGNLKAYVSVRVGTLDIHDCRLIEEPGKNPWLSMPVVSYRTRFGEVRYRPLLVINDKILRNEITRVAVTAWEENERRNKNERVSAR